MKKAFAGFILVFCMAGFVFAQDEGVDLTIYNQNFALVKDRRAMELEKGVSRIKFTDVASGIEPASVHFKSLTAPQDCTIEEQDYEYDLVGSSKLLSKYIDNKIKILTGNGSVYEGTLLSYDNDNIIIANSEDRSLNMVSRQDNIRSIEFNSLPEGLITKPTLKWQISNGKAGRHLTELSYLTNGLNWLCDYVVVLNKDDKNIDLSGWVTIDNQSGATYKDAGIKLIAGDVHRVKQGSYEDRAAGFMAMKTEAAPQFEEKSFFEYHMYTLQRKATVQDNQTKQISLLNASGVPVEKLFIFDPVIDYGWGYYQNTQDSGEHKVKVRIEIVNSQKNNLGMPLPKGKIRVYKQDTDGKLEFIGEDAIDHTPKDEKIRLYIGDAFDVVAERKQVNYKVSGRTADESFEISLRNHKEETVDVTVVERLWRYANWKITDKNYDFTKKDSQAIEFKVPVAKNSETKIKYTVHYWW